MGRRKRVSAPRLRPSQTGQASTQCQQTTLPAITHITQSLSMRWHTGSSLCKGRLHHPTLPGTWRSETSTAHTSSHRQTYNTPHAFILGLFCLFFLPHLAVLRTLCPRITPGSAWGSNSGWLNARQTPSNTLPAVPWFRQAPLFLHADSRHSEAESASAH